MKPPRRVPARPTESLTADFAAVRAELRVPGAFPDDVLAAAQSAARAALPTGLLDRRDVELVTVDPEGSRDLDQALHIERTADGFRVFYAIADVAAFVEPDGPIEAEAWRRGVTFYSPDERATLYPPVLSEGAASLLEGQDRPSILFCHELDARGERLAFTVERALVRSRRQLSYDVAQREGVPLLEEVGRLRIALEEQRGAVRIDSPSQAIEPDASPAGYRLTLESRLPIEDWNEQISLLTGIAAADVLHRGGAGVLRTMAAPDPGRLDSVRAVAASVGVPWEEDETLPALLRRLDRKSPRDATVIEAARHAMGRADYTAIASSSAPAPRHAAIGAAYAHVTAPLRRLVDRYDHDLLLALARDARPEARLLEQVTRLPGVMNAADGLAGRLERALVDVVEARVLAPRVGEEFDAVVIDERAGSATIQIPEPPIRSRMAADPAPAVGQAIRVRLLAVDAVRRTLTFAPAG